MAVVFCRLVRPTDLGFPAVVGEANKGASGRFFLGPRLDAGSTTGGSVFCVVVGE